MNHLDFINIKSFC